MRARRIPIFVAAGALVLAGMSAFTPLNSITRNVSASLDVGWYVRLPFATPEPGSIVMLPIPDRAREIAARGGMDLDRPLLKRVESITQEGRLVVKGDCGGDRSLDSRYFGSVGLEEITGVYAPLPWTLTPCPREGAGSRREEREVYRKEEIFEPDKAGFPQDCRRIEQKSFSANALAVPQALPASCGTVPQPSGSEKNA